MNFKLNHRINKIISNSHKYERKKKFGDNSLKKENFCFEINEKFSQQ